MTDREKLIELLLKGEDAVPCYRNPDYDCDGIKCPSCERATMAGFLIANGVTFAKDTDVPSKWISVEERLPEDYENVLTCDHKGNIHTMRHYHGFKAPFGIEKTDRRYYPVTHWMPLPQPPREE